MTPADLAAIKAMLEGVTPVAVRGNFDGYGWQYLDSGSGSDWLTRWPDAEPLFDAASREAVPALVAEVERLRLARDADRLWLEAKALSAQADAEEWARKCAVADDEVERLRARMAKLEGALRWISRFDDDGALRPDDPSLTKVCQRARAALNPEENDAK